MGWFTKEDPSKAVSVDGVAVGKNRGKYDLLCDYCTLMGNFTVNNFVTKMNELQI